MPKQPGTEKRIHVGDTGIELQAKITEDLTGATVQNILVKKPDGTVLTALPTTTVTPATNGDIKTSTLTAIFDVAGKWKRWAEVSWGASVALKGQVTEFMVYADENL